MITSFLINSSSITSFGLTIIYPILPLAISSGVVLILGVALISIVSLAEIISLISCVLSVLAE